MREDDDRRAVAEPLDILGKPLELLIPQHAKPAGLKVHHVDQADKVHATMREALPSRAARAFAVAIQILLGLVAEHIMLAGNVKRLLHLRAFADLRDGIEFFGLGKMRQISGVQEQVGPARERVDSIDRDPQCAGHILVDLLAKADVAVADLRKGEIIGACFIRLTQRPRGENSAAADRPDHAGADPGHTLEKSATVNAVAIDLLFMVIHVLSPVHVHFTMILPVMWG